MDGFAAAVETLLGHEGGYVSAQVAEARGDSETNWGISKRSYPNLDIKNLTRVQAIAIYRRDFWDALHCGDMPASIGRMVFDMAVNAGQGTAAKALQTAIGGLKADGHIGPMTLAALARANPRAVVDEFCARRMVAYGDTPQQEWNANKLGWARRLMAEHRIALSEA